ncbi:hypothetical protein A9Q02_13415 [Candidatus Chloroploca asiatica]|uniref:asparagine synthase (glutamine-hydrolyzing) n=2 Tax=Candidatus Chloroploca asiatica TaxID=1506545 RepID=A0A2H3KYK8_9CHLR|nr:hypothetical protein A9Q02_13415 [Candidatus Chloroploca asiatica]
MRNLSGSFILLALDNAEQRLIAATDRLASRPLYLAELPGLLLIATDICALLSLPGVRYHLDPVGIAQFIRLQMIIDDRTIYQEIRTLDPASLLSIDLRTGKYAKYCYWHMQPGSAYESDDEATAAIVTAFRNAGQRITRDAGRSALLLSGGVDSRMVLASITPYLNDCTCMTFGPDLTDEGEVAQALARQTQLPWKLIKQSASDYWEQLEVVLPSLQGMFSLAHTHTWKTVSYSSAIGFTTIFDGWGIDAFLAGSYMPKHHFTIWGHKFYSYNFPKIANQTEAQHYLLMTLDCHMGDFANSYLSPGYYTAWDMASQLIENQVSQVSIHWKDPLEQMEKVLTGLMGRFRSQPMLRSIRTHARQRSPLFDAEILDTYLRLTPRQRFLGPVYRAALQQLSPAMARMRYANTGASLFAPPLIQAFHLQVRQFWRANRERIRLTLNHMGIKHLIRQRSYGSYAHLSELLNELSNGVSEGAQRARSVLIDGPLVELGCIDRQRVIDKLNSSKHSDLETQTLISLTTLATWLDRYPAQS